MVCLVLAFGLCGSSVLSLCLVCLSPVFAVFAVFGGYLVFFLVSQGGQTEEWFLL